MTTPLLFAPVPALVLLLALLAAIAPAKAEVVVVVPVTSKVDTLTSAQVRDIFLGRTSAFPGGETALPIEHMGDNSRDEFHRLLSGRTAVELKAYWAKMVFAGQGVPPKSVASSSEALRIIAQTPNAIGYINKTKLDASVKVVLKLQ